MSGKPGAIQAVVEAFAEMDTEGPSLIGRDEPAPGVDAPPIPMLATTIAQPIGVVGPGEIAVSGIPFATPDHSGSPVFTRMEGGEIGLDAPAAYTIDMFLELGGFRGLASGDVHNDGHTDVLVATNAGPALCVNLGDGSFVRQAIDLRGLDDLIVLQPVLVDLDDDGWLDMFLTTTNTKRRGRDSNPHVLADASFQDWCISRSATPPSGTPTLGGQRSPCALRIAHGPV